MRVSWDLIRSFRAVAEDGSLSAASRRLKVTQPTVGRHIDLLERELNTPLFIRSREGMQLTATGADLVAVAHQMNEAASGFERLAAGLDQDISGTVRVSANEIFGVLLLPELLGTFMAQNPGIDVELVVSNAASNLLQRDADVAVRLFRPAQNDLVARKLADLPLGLYAHADYLAERPMPRRLADLHDHVFIGFDRETGLIDVGELLGESFTPRDFGFRSDNILTHIQAIRSGVGIGVTHRGLAQAWEDVEQVLADIRLPALELWIACHADVRYNRRVRMMMDFLAEALKQPYERYVAL